MQGCRKKPVGMLEIVSQTKPKAIMPSLMAAERGYYELQIRVGKKCHRCKYFSQRTKTCDYCNIMRQSRLYTNGVRLDPRLCNKFVVGRRDYDPRLWNWGKDESND